LSSWFLKVLEGLKGSPRVKTRSKQDVKRLKRAKLN
jgi:hypothetical protein